MNESIRDLDTLIQEQKNLANKRFEKEVEYVLTRSSGYQQVIKYTRKKYISPEMIEEMKNMLNQGIKRKLICEKFNISMPTLKKYTY